MNKKIILNNNSIKFVEIANELSISGVQTLIRPDFSGEIASDVCALILDKSNVDSAIELPAKKGNVKIFVLTNGENSRIFAENGVLYIPVTLSAENIVSLVRHNIGAITELHKTVAKYLMEIGVPAHTKGYRCLIELVVMVIESPDPTGRFHKEFYPAIAEKFGFKQDCIERNVRTLIDIMYERHEKGYFTQFFGYYLSRPSVTEFVTIIAEKIKNEIL